MVKTCFTDQHLVVVLAVGIPGLVCFVIAPPVVLFYILYKHRGSKLYDDCTKVRLLFLYHPYQDEFYFWEAVKLVFILALVAVRVFGVLLREEDILAVFLLILILFTLLVVGLHPHNFETVYRMELTSLIITMLATYAMLFVYLQPERTEESSAFDAVLIFIGIVFMLFALTLVLWIGFKVFYE